MRYEDLSIEDFYNECKKDKYIENLDILNFIKRETNYQTSELKLLLTSINRHIDGLPIDYRYHFIENGINYSNIKHTSLLGICFDNGNKHLIKLLKEKDVYRIIKGLEILGYEIYRTPQVSNFVALQSFIHEKLELSIQTKTSIEPVAIENTENKSNDITINEKIDNKNEIQSLSELFSISDWNRYIDVLTLCEPKLLKKENGKYIFIGNKKTQKGCIAQWFKYLKNRGIIHQSTNRDDLARVISLNIEDFTIVGSSINNESKTYIVTFEKQLKNLLSMS